MFFLKNSQGNQKIKGKDHHFYKINEHPYCKLNTLITYVLSVQASGAALIEPLALWECPYVPGVSIEREEKKEGAHSFQYKQCFD